MENIDIYKEVRECDYKGEHYSVRDNGAVMRHAREGKRIRKDDEQWTFGKQDAKTGYMLIGQARVHIICSFAFFGESDTKKYVVDHIDTNRANNRITNLRWITRLENVLKNPVTLKRVTMLCGGDITKFIKDPSCLRDLTGTNQDILWMRTVSPEDAENAYNNVMRWAMTASNNNFETTGTKDEWIYSPSRPIHPNEIPTRFIDAASPANALQMDWKTPCNFVCCPSAEEATLEDYYNNMHKDESFLTNKYTTDTIADFAWADDGKALLVAVLIGKGAKDYALCKIYKQGIQFIHQSIQTFFTLDGMMKRFTILQGKEWTGPDSIDDYC